MSNFLLELAVAHAKHEGYFVGSLSYRNNNPGNLRGKDGVFVKYPTLALGYAALQGDLSAKIENRSSAMNAYYRRHNMTYEKATFQDYINVYAPSADRNNPSAYCNALCKDLSKYNLKPSTPLSVMAQLVRREIERVPDPISPVTVTAEARIKGLERRKKTASPDMVRTIDRQIKRLLARVGRTS